MPITPIQTYDSYAQGRQNRLQSDFQGTRNKLAVLEADNAPQHIAQQNQLAGLQIQQAQQGLNADQAKTAHTTLMQALDSGNPRQFIIQNVPQLAGKLQQQGIDLNSMDDQAATSLVQNLARKYGGEAGIAPTPKLETIGDTSNPAAGVFQKNPTTGALTQVVAPQKPDVLSEYERRRLAIEERKAGKTGQAKPPAGYQWSADGSSLEKIPGGPADKASEPPKLTEFDKRARVLYSSVLNAEKDIQGQSGADTSSGTQRALGSNPLTRGMQSDEYRKYEAAGLRWAANMLYLKSGATAPVEEVESTWKQFFPQFGDGEEVKQQKAAARLQEINAVADAFGLDKSQIPKPPTAKQAGGGPVKVSSPTEAMKLPPGTVFITPDGRRKVR